MNEVKKARECPGGRSVVPIGGECCNRGVVASRDTKVPSMMRVTAQTPSVKITASAGEPSVWSVLTISTSASIAVPIADKSSPLLPDDERLASCHDCKDFGKWQRGENRAASHGARRDGETDNEDQFQSDGYLAECVEWGISPSPCLGSLRIECDRHTDCSTRPNTCLWMRRAFVRTHPRGRGCGLRGCLYREVPAKAISGSGDTALDAVSLDGAGFIEVSVQVRKHPERNVVMPARWGRSSWPRRSAAGNAVRSRLVISHQCSNTAFSFSGGSAEVRSASGGAAGSHFGSSPFALSAYANGRIEGDSLLTVPW